MRYLEKKKYNNVNILKNTDSRRNKMSNSDSAAKNYPESIPTST